MTGKREKRGIRRPAGFRRLQASAICSAADSIALAEQEGDIFADDMRQAYGNAIPPLTSFNDIIPNLARHVSQKER